MRVVAGTLGGRTLVAPRGQRTRPTADRVREALFSALGDLGGAIVADLWAGSGALGIEALSRGAARAAFVENDHRALAALRRNLEALDLSARATVLGAPVERAVRRLARDALRFDLVLADPPWAEVAPDRAARVGRILGDVVAGAGSAAWRIVLEHARRDAPPAVPGATFAWTRAYGDTAITLYLPAGDREPARPAS